MINLNNGYDNNNDMIDRIPLRNFIYLRYCRFKIWYKIIIDDIENNLNDNSFINELSENVVSSITIVDDNKNNEKCITFSSRKEIALLSPWALIIIAVIVFFFVLKYHLC